MPSHRSSYLGHIAGFGTTEGTRVVVGRWLESPLGQFADVMVERADGARLLLAPRDDVAELVGETYTFDSVHIVPVTVTADRSTRRWSLVAGPLTAEMQIGSRTAVGHLLRLLPTSPAMATVLADIADPFARTLLDGVRTRGSAGGNRREWYTASDQHVIDAVRATWGARSLGALAPVDPPVKFGFSSVPTTPSVTRVRTTIDDSRVMAARRR